jgi:anti-sigma-K factor RskA
MPGSRRDLHDLAGAYALDALDDGPELRRFIRHLRHCEACAAEVRGFREVTTSLALASAAEPPPELRQRVMAAVQVTRQLPPEVASSRAFPGWMSRVARMPRLPRGAWLPRLAMATAAAAVAAVVVLSIALSGTVQQLHSAQAQGRAIAAVLAAPDARTVTGKVATGGVTTVLLSVDRRELVVASTGLAALPTGRAYQLWLIGPTPAGKKTVIRSAGLLPPAAAGRTAPVVASGLAAGDKLGLTVEPAGGSKQPTTTPILLLTLPSRDVRSPAVRRTRA